MLPYQCGPNVLKPADTWRTRRPGSHHTQLNIKLLKWISRTERTREKEGGGDDGHSAALSEAGVNAVQQRHPLFS